MIHNLRRFFNSNKVVIIRNILIIFFAFLIIQGMNYYAKQKSINNNKVTINNKFIYGNLIDFSNSVNKNNIVNSSNEIDNTNQIGSNNSIGNVENQVINNQGNNINSNNNTEINSNLVNENKDSEKEKAVSSFLDLCIQGNAEQAYEIISDECKKVLFSTVERFKKNYYSRIFNSNKSYTIEKYYGNTYKVRLTENMNTIGAYTPLANTDYITVDYTEDGIKLNINNYIGRFNINSTAKQNNITIKVNYKDVFMEYERYNISVNNEYEKSILLNAYGSNNTMYLSNNHDNRYYAYINEISKNSLVLRSGSNAEFNIKYNCLYNEYTRNISKLVFSNIILDYDSYNKMDGNSEYKEICSITVEI